VCGAFDFIISFQTFCQPPVLGPTIRPAIARTLFSISAFSFFLQELLETSLFRNARILKVHFHFLRNKHFFADLSNVITSDHASCKAVARINTEMCCV
jgi:hypothetical protein